jgi:integrase/recombinase XerD
MKQLPLYNPAFIEAERGFKEWLDILGYAAITAYNMPNAVREFFHWMERKKHAELTDIIADDITNYYAYLKIRKNIIS